MEEENEDNSSSSGALSYNKKEIKLNLKEYTKESANYNLTVNNLKFSQSTRIGNYVYYVPCIGKGSFSKVFIGHHIRDKDPRHNENRLVAIKRINTSSIRKMSIKRLNSEISLLKTLDHKNIVKFYEAFTDISNNIYIVTEYCNSGSLELYTKSGGSKLDYKTIKKYMTGVRDGLKYLICNNILHRDLKPQNILLHKEGDQIVVKIADFGFAKQYDMLDEDSITNTLCGTPMYLAPELVKHKKYTLVSDLWSIGIIFYQLFHHCTPFKKPKNILELIQNIDIMKIKFHPFLYSNVKDLMEGLLQTDPYKRINWDNFITHKYFDEDHITPSDNIKLPDDISPTSITENKLNVSLKIPRMLQYEGLSSDEEDEENQNGSKAIGIPITNQIEKSFIQQTSKLYSEPNIVNDYIEFIPSSVPTEKSLNKSSESSQKATSSWTDSPVLKYITSSLTKITETLSLGK